MNRIWNVLLTVLLLSGFISLDGKAAEVPELYAQSAVLMDGDTGRVLFGKNEGEIRAMASTTKIMTCILVLENASMVDVAEVSAYAAGQPQVKLSASAGEIFKIEDLLYSLMLESHNDTAVVLAEKVGGSVQRFAEMMNEKARELGCMDTHFVTPNGLDGEDDGGVHATTAKDLARILCYCTYQSPKKDEFLTITRTKSHAFSNVQGTRTYSCNNHNAYLSISDEAVTGKTGFTGNAGYCYVGAVESEGRRFVIALLACGWPNNKGYKWADMRELTEYGKQNYHFKTIAFSKKTDTIPVKNGIPGSGRRKDMCRIKTKLTTGKMNTVRLLLSKEDQVEIRQRIRKELAAPVKSGREVGSICILLNGEEIDERKIVTDEEVRVLNYQWCAKKVADYFVSAFLQKSA